MLLMIIDYDRPLLILSTWTCYSWVQKFQWLLREEITTQLYGIICLQPTFSSHIFNSIFILYTLITNTLSHLLFPFSGGDFSYSSQFSFSWNLYMFQLKKPTSKPTSCMISLQKPLLSKDKNAYSALQYTVHLNCIYFFFYVLVILLCFMSCTWVNI